MTTPIVSIVTGSYNRLTLLRQMVGSARASMPKGTPCEFVVVTASDDLPTVDWCMKEPDIRLIIQDGLHGAIRAFDAGIDAAVGDYTLLANDDIVFLDDSIAHALMHLETHPTVGAIAFADDRRAPGKLVDPDGFGVQTINVQNGQPGKPYVYAQVGMFRTPLLKLLGGWGSNDPIMRQGHTYGGDNYASARLYDFGYTVEPLPRVRIHDTVVNDDLRALNREAEAKNSAVYYKRYPQGGPTLAERPLIPPRGEERLRVLYLPIYEPGTFHDTQVKNKRGLREALARIGLVWEMDWVEAQHRQSFDLAGWVQRWQPHILLTQFQAADAALANRVITAYRRKPDMLVLNWSGDVYKHLMLSEDMLRMLRATKAIQLVVNATLLPLYEREGIPAAYWQVAYEPVDEDALPDAMPHDVLLMANTYTEPRRQLDNILRSIPDINLGLYGNGHQMATVNTTYDFPTGAALIRKAKIVIGDNQYPDDIAFVSNRLFETLANGGFLLHQHIPGIEDWLGLIPGVHFMEYERIEDLPRVIPYWLAKARDKQRMKIAAAGQAEVLKHHSFSARLDELFDEILPRVMGG